MAARTAGQASKIVHAESAVSWSLCLDSGRGSEILPIQKWRVSGCGVSSKDKIRAFSNLYQKSLEGKILLPHSSSTWMESNRSSQFEGKGESDQDCPDGVELRQSVAPDECLKPVFPLTEEAEVPFSYNRSSSSPASLGQKIRVSDEYTPGQKETLEETELEDEIDEMPVKEAYRFQIFKTDDMEKKQPASIVNLSFDLKEGQESSSRMLMIAYSAKNSNGLFMRTIDSWTVKSDADQNLSIYVREVKGSFIKLINPRKQYEVSIHSAMILVNCLELAMGFRKTRAKTFLDQLLEKTGSGKREIMSVLRKYFIFIEKFLRRKRKSLPITTKRLLFLKNLKLVVTGTAEKAETLSAEEAENMSTEGSLERPCKKTANCSAGDNSESSSFNDRLKRLSNEPKKIPMRRKKAKADNVVPATQESLMKLEADLETISARDSKPDNVAPAAQDCLMEFKADMEMPSTSGSGKTSNDVAGPEQACLKKRRRVVESDSNNESDFEDHIPFSQRIFRISDRPVSEKLFWRDEQGEITDTDYEPGKGCGSTYEAEENLAKIDRPVSLEFAKKDGSSSWCGGGDLEKDFRDIAAIQSLEIDESNESEASDDSELENASLCEICDEGGDLLICEGPCKRAFHASEMAAAKENSKCPSLGLQAEYVARIDAWLCANCKQSEHQCFKCGKLGKSGGEDKDVFVCSVARCGRFYHLRCLLDWRREGQSSGSQKMKSKNVLRQVRQDDGGFCCPAHECGKCGKGDGQFVKCRRCPMAYHKRCLPKEISIHKRAKNEQIRAWKVRENMMIYCLKHNIVSELQTPERTHLTWPKRVEEVEELGQIVSPDDCVPICPGNISPSRSSLREDACEAVPVSIPNSHLVPNQHGETNNLNRSFTERETCRSQRPVSAPTLTSKFSSRENKDPVSTSNLTSKCSLRENDRNTISPASEQEAPLCALPSTSKGSSLRENILGIDALVNFPKAMIVPKKEKDADDLNRHSCGGSLRVSKVPKKEKEADGGHGHTFGSGLVPSSVPPSSIAELPKQRDCEIPNPGQGRKHRRGYESWEDFDESTEELICETICQEHQVGKHSALESRDSGNVNDRSQQKRLERLAKWRARQNDKRSLDESVPSLKFRNRHPRHEMPNGKNLSEDPTQALVQERRSQTGVVEKATSVATRHPGIMKDEPQKKPSESVEKYVSKYVSHFHDQRSHGHHKRPRIKNSIQDPHHFETSHHKGAHARNVSKVRSQVPGLEGSSEEGEVQQLPSLPARDSGNRYNELQQKPCRSAEGTGGQKCMGHLDNSSQDGHVDEHVLTAWLSKSQKKKQNLKQRGTHDESTQVPDIQRQWPPTKNLNDNQAQLRFQDKSPQGDQQWRCNNMIYPPMTCMHISISAMSNFPGHNMHGMPHYPMHSMYGCPPHSMHGCPPHSMYSCPPHSMHGCPPSWRSRQPYMSTVGPPLELYDGFTTNHLDSRSYGGQYPPSFQFGVNRDSETGGCGGWLD